jgi:hypothetical protein
MQTFRDKLMKLIIEETGGKPITRVSPETNAEIVESLASQLGLYIAMSCRGDAQQMSMVLEGATAYAFEAAAEFQKDGRGLGSR